MFDGIAARRRARWRATRRVRAVVLHGEGKSFCSGLDIASFMARRPRSAGRPRSSRDGDAARTSLSRSCYDWIDVPVPVIAAVHGNCFGGGLQIALGADIRIAAPDARLSVMEIRWGLVPDMGITQTLPRLVPIDVAKELTFTGRMVTGEEAAALGLVTRTADDPLAAARDLAAEIAASRRRPCRPPSASTTRRGTATTRTARSCWRPSCRSS